MSTEQTITEPEYSEYIYKKGTKYEQTLYLYEFEDIEEEIKKFVAAEHVENSNIGPEDMATEDRRAEIEKVIREFLNEFKIEYDDRYNSTMQYGNRHTYFIKITSRKDKRKHVELELGMPLYNMDNRPYLDLQYVIETISSYGADPEEYLEEDETTRAYKEAKKMSQKIWRMFRYYAEIGLLNISF